jgi:hypothetical protein
LLGDGAQGLEPRFDVRAAKGVQASTENEQLISTGARGRNESAVQREQLTQAPAFLSSPVFSMNIDYDKEGACTTISASFCPFKIDQCGRHRLAGDCCPKVRRRAPRLPAGANNKGMTLQACFQVADVDKGCKWKEDFAPMDTGDSVWQIVCNKNSAFSSELVVHFQGVLCKSDLPPFLQRIACVCVHTPKLAFTH